ncbi:MAG: negative regulator of flagellin synthesis FlgM [Paraglaciecola sp.]
MLEIVFFAKVSVYSADTIIEVNKRWWILIMSINNINNGSPKASVDNHKLSQQQQTLNNGIAQKSDTQKPTTGVRQDSVSLTLSAQQFTQVQKKGLEAPINQEKVDRLKKSVQSGEYQINPESLAQKISTLETQLFGAKV